MISLRTVAILLGMYVFFAWALAHVGAWAAFITLPLCLYVGLGAAELDRREGRRS